LKQGLRPGDGITAPCGAYTGKYTRDYEYLCGKGDLDECNGIQSFITLLTENGEETFPYFYVITSTFPQIPRCLMGNTSDDFENGNDPLTGVDNDNDGFLEAFDCDDNNADINPLAEEILGNDIDENCDGLTTSLRDFAEEEIVVSPNPSNGDFRIELPSNEWVTITTFSIDGKLISSKTGSEKIEFKGFEPGLYILQISFKDGTSFYKKQTIQ
jgi:hypothetical protein